MAFLCPQCGIKSLTIESKIELPPDRMWDEITLQLISCQERDYFGVAIYEQSRRGALDSELFNHIGYCVPHKDYVLLKETIKKCPHPRKWRCKCTAYLRLGSKNASGRWVGLDNIHSDGAYKIRYK